MYLVSLAESFLSKLKLAMTSILFIRLLGVPKVQVFVAFQGCTIATEEGKLRGSTGCHVTLDRAEASKKRKTNQATLRSD